MEKQLSVLEKEVLEKLSEGGKTTRKLAIELRRQFYTVKAALEILEAKGFVRKAICEKQLIVWELTERGKQVLEKLKGKTIEIKN